MLLLSRSGWLMIVCLAILFPVQSREAQAQRQDTLIVSKGTTIYLAEGNHDKKRQGFDVFNLRASYIPTGSLMVRKGDRWVIPWQGRNWAFVNTVTGLSGYIEEDNYKSYWDEITILKWHRDKHITQMLSVHFRTNAEIIWPDQCGTKSIELLPRVAYRAIDTAPGEFPDVLIAPNDFSIVCGPVIPNHLFVRVPPQSYSVYFMPQSVAFSALEERVESEAIHEATQSYQDRSRRRLTTADISGGCTEEEVEFTEEDRKKLIASISAQLEFVGLSGAIEREQIIKMVRKIKFDKDEEYSAFFFGVPEPKGIARIITKGPCGGRKEFFYGTSDSITATKKISFDDFMDFDTDQEIIIKCTEQFIKAQEILDENYQFDRYETTFLLTQIARIHDADKGAQLPRTCR